MSKPKKSKPAISKFYVSRQAIRFTTTQVFAQTLSKGSKQTHLLPESVENMANLPSDPNLKTLLTGWNPGQGITLCIPESSIFTRIIEITSPIQEMHETVLWQVQNYLPLPPDQMVIDWQILKENGPQTTLQVVAAPKSNLEMYVKALRSHGVKVIDIDTPSMVLSRIISDLDLPGIIIEAEEESAIVVSSQKNAIDYVSVVYDLAAVPQVALQMINYFFKKNNQDIPNIYLVGSQASKISSQIKSSAHIKVLDANATIVLDRIANKPVAPPTSRETINLVPSEYNVDYAQASNSTKRNKFFNITAWCLLILNLLAGYFVFSAWQVYSNSKPSPLPETDLQRRVDQFNKSKLEIDLVINSSKDRIKASQGLTAVVTSLPPAITLSNIRFVLANQSLTIVGISPTQAEILEFKDALDKTGVFHDVKLPLSVYERREPVPFTLNLVINLNK